MGATIDRRLSGLEPLTSIVESDGTVIEAQVRGPELDADREEGRIARLTRFERIAALVKRLA